jgi:hypothetical protein
MSSRYDCAAQRQATRGGQRMNWGSVLTLRTNVRASEQSHTLRG